MLQSDIMEIYAAHVDAIYHTDESMVESEEDDTFKDYLNRYTLSELKNLHKAVTISTASPFGRSVPTNTTTKGAAISLILVEVKSRHTV